MADTLYQFYYIRNFTQNLNSLDNNCCSFSDGITVLLFIAIPPLDDIAKFPAIHNSLNNKFTGTIVPKQIT